MRDLNSKNKQVDEYKRVIFLTLLEKKSLSDTELDMALRQKNTFLADFLDDMLLSRALQEMTAEGFIRQNLKKGVLLFKLTTKGLNPYYLRPTSGADGYFYKKVYRVEVTQYNNAG